MLRQTSFGQGDSSPIILQTGGGQPLVSASQSLTPFPLNNPPPLVFEFGFATDEVFGPSALFDSFTITLQNDAMSQTLVLATIDAGGVVWAPPTPGTLFLDPSAVTHFAVAFADLQPVLTTRTAFAVSVIAPVQFHGQSSTLYLDLFDNLNTTRSLGYLNSAAVPEPATWTIVLGGGLVLLLFRRKRK